MYRGILPSFCARRSPFAFNKSLRSALLVKLLLPTYYTHHNQSRINRTCPNTNIIRVAMYCKSCGIKDSFQQLHYNAAHNHCTHFKELQTEGKTQTIRIFLNSICQIWQTKGIQPKIGITCKVKIKHVYFIYKVCSIKDVSCIWLICQICQIWREKFTKTFLFVFTVLVGVTNGDFWRNKIAHLAKKYCNLFIFGNDCAKKLEIKYWLVQND